MASNRQTATDRVIDEVAGEKKSRALAAARGVSASNRRFKRRHFYRAYVVIVLVSPTGDRGKPLLLRAKDISNTGMRVVSRQMIFPGSDGAVQLVRSDGRMALVGVRVKYCRYVGDMEHHTGLEFIPLPRGLTTNDFLDKNGSMILMDPMLERNYWH